MAEKVDAPPSGGVELQFVVGNNPEQLKGTARRQARSHAARLGWKAHRSAASSRDDQEQRRRKRQQVKSSYTVTFECIDVTEPQATLQALNTRAQDENTTPARPPPTLDWLLGGLRVDPFRSYPCQWQPFIPAIVDHYIVHMAQDIPELDQPGNRGLLRTRWFPLVISDPSAFQTVLLLAASNMVAVKGAGGAACHILQLKANAIKSIASSFVDESNKGEASDALIGAVAKMASFEAMHGNLESYHVHMQGVVRMVSLRGGLAGLGLDGLLRRIIVWIDLNSSFLLKVERYFPGEMFAQQVEEDDAEPNPARFTAA